GGRAGTGGNHVPGRGGTLVTGAGAGPGLHGPGRDAMTSTQTDNDSVLTYCERHPGVETALTCGRCEAYICPRCMVHTPGGIRCPDCARLRRPVMYELETKHYLLALGTALAVAIPLGVAAAVVLPILRFGFFGL